MLAPLDHVPVEKPGPDPDRFNRFFAALILAAVACGVIAWRVV